MTKFTTAIATAATALLLLTLCFSLFWLVERGLGGKNAEH